MQRNYTDQELVAMPRVNVQLLDETLDYIIAHQDAWDQAGWGMRSNESDCGTTLCFGGQACALAGEKITVSNGDVLLNGRSHGWYETAKEHLGLNSVEAQALFYDTIYVFDPDDDLTAEQFKAAQLKNVKVEVERIRARAKAQDEAFNRIAQEFIDAAGLDDVVQPGYRCPESEAIVQGIKGGASE